MCTGFRIRKGMMVPHQVITAGRRNGLKLMVRKAGTKVPAGRRQRIVEDIVRIIHPVDFENRFQAAFIKAAVVSDQRKSIDERDDPLPHFRKYGCIFRVLRA